MSGIDITDSRFCAATRRAHGNMVEAIYRDIDERPLDYSAITRDEIEAMSKDVRLAQAMTIRMFRNACLADLRGDGVSEGDAEATAESLIAQAVDSGWDTHIDTLNDVSPKDVA